MIGTTVSHYKILEKLGGGGMGVVYKAQDLKLDRHVALKFLPPELTLDPEAKERFVHEAKAASALDHNNICTVHEIAETDEGQIFIVMACYEGETLKKKIERGQLKIEEATDLAIQIAQGLSEAHAHGIVHRDVKPANILITKSGVAKIVDFGLAKLSGRTKLTKTGSTLGTVAYMSPEQLQGSEADARADIFSLGVVLYEMLTGKTPFRGDHEAALMYSIVNQEPEPLQNLVPDVPAELIHVVSRALEKSPADRYKTMDDLLIDLRRLRRETSKVSMPTFRQIAQHGFTWKYAAFIGLSVIIIGVVVVVFILPSSRKMPQLNPDAKMHTVKMPVTNTGYPCLSSDGNWIAVSGTDANGKGDVYFMNASGGDVRRITDDSCSYGYVGEISRDGAWIACHRFNKGKSEIAIIPSQGGKTQAVCAGMSPIWTTDNQRLLYVIGPALGIPTKSGKNEVWSIRREGTDSRLEFIDPSISGGMFSVSLSPDGKSVAWIKTFTDFSNDIITHNLETGKESQITFTKSVMDEVFWTNDNFIIYSSNRSGNFDLWMCPADGGESIQITRSTQAKLRGQLSADGRKLLYYEFQQVGNTRIMNLESGKVSAITSDDLNRAGLSISPDNQRLAFIPINAYPSILTWYGIQVIDRRRVESPWDLVRDVRMGWYTMWSPDGRWIAFIGRPNSVDEASRICVVSPSSPASFRVIGKAEQDPPAYTRGITIRWLDEHTLEWFTPKQMKTWMSSIEDPNPQQFYDDSTLAYPIQDGRYILFRDYRRGREGWWIDMSPAVTKGSGRITKKILGPLNVSIAPDGRFLLYRTSNGELQKVTLPDGKAQRLPFRIQNIFQPFGKDDIGVITVDGKELAYIEHVTTGKVVLVENPFVWK
jgi:serine/threonine protein kinase/Tol biopolymer transport system component